MSKLEIEKAILYIKFMDGLDPEKERDLKIE